MLAQTGKVGILRRPAGEVTRSPTDAFAQLVERAVRKTGACEGARDIVADAAVVRRNRERALCLRDTRVHLATVHDPDREEHAGERAVRIVLQRLALVAHPGDRARDPTRAVRRPRPARRPRDPPTTSAPAPHSTRPGRRGPERTPGRARQRAGAAAPLADCPRPCPCRAALAP